MITHENDLLGPENDRHHALRLRGLHALVDQDGGELGLREPRISGSDASATDHIRQVQKFLLCLAFQGSVTLLVSGRQLAGLSLQLLKLLQFSETKVKKSCVTFQVTKGV